MESVALDRQPDQGHVQLAGPYAGRGLGLLSWQQQQSGRSPALPPGPSPLVRGDAGHEGDPQPSPAGPGRGPGGAAHAEARR